MLTGIKGWRAALGDVSPEMLESLGPWLPRLAALLGPLRHDSGVGSDEPDGYDGFDRQAAWSRLPPSSWLLLDEAPDEFLRRVAAAELLFYRVQRREPAGQRVVDVRFDVGPSSLGSPRLAHLALWCTLAQRAERVGARLRWSVLQDPTICGEGWSADAALALLDARSQRPPGAEALAASLGAGASVAERALLATVGAAAREDVVEAWWVGSSALLPSLQRLRGRGGPILGLIAVDEPPRLDAPVLQVHRFAGGDGAGRAVELPLPPPARRAQILRWPLRRSAPVTHSSRQGVAEVAGVVRVELALGADALFSESGDRLLARTTDGTLVAIPMPKGEGRPRGLQSMTLPVGGTLLAVGWHRSKLVAVVERGAVWQIWRKGSLETRACARPAEESDAADLQRRVKPTLLWARRSREDDGVEVRFVAPSGELRGLGIAAPTKDEEHGVRTLALSTNAHGLVAVQAQRGEHFGYKLVEAWPHHVIRRALPKDVYAAHFGWNRGDGSRTLVVEQVFGGALLVTPDPRSADKVTVEPLALPDNAKIWGATAVGSGGQRLSGVLASTDDGCALGVSGVNGLLASMPEVDGPLQWAVAAVGRPLVAWKDARGITHVYDLHRQQVIVEITPSEVR